MNNNLLTIIVNSMDTKRTTFKHSMKASTNDNTPLIKPIQILPTNP